MVIRFTRNRNRVGGEITIVTTATTTDYPVVIKGRADECIGRMTGTTVQKR